MEYKRTAFLILYQNISMCAYDYSIYVYHMYSLPFLEKENVPNKKATIFVWLPFIS